MNPSSKTDFTLVQIRALCEACRGFYGPHRCWKAVVDPKTLSSSLTADPLEVLQVTCASTRAGDLLYRACTDHRQQCGCGVSSMLALIRELCTQISYVRHTYSIAPSRIAQSNHEVASIVLAFLLEKLAKNCKNVLDDPTSLEALRHGPDEDSVHDAAVKTVRRLSLDNGFCDTGAILLHRVKSGFTRNVHVFPGLLLPSNQATVQTWIDRGGPLKIRRIALLRNSLSLRSADLGSHQAARLDPQLVATVGPALFQSNAPLTTHRVNRILSSLRNAQVDLVVCSGSVDDEIVFSAGSDILILSHAQIRQLEGLMRMFQTHIFTDLEQLLAYSETAPIFRANVKSISPRSWGEPSGKGAHFFHIEEDKSDSLRSETLISHEQVPVSVLFTSPVDALLEDMERRYWSSVHRIRNVLYTPMVLPGAGETEQKLADMLQIHAYSCKDPVSGIVFEAWARAFRAMTYYELPSPTSSSSSCSSLPRLVLDDLVSKQASIDYATRLMYRILN
mmetsp:Transcript_12380/g.24077  ORF Transcript_12380/g.24077 Transcript_12380/m.24077 type:complete len:505 (-) Transcript_12380:154-1668(-)